MRKMLRSGLIIIGILAIASASVFANGSTEKQSSSGGTSTSASFVPGAQIKPPPGHSLYVLPADVRASKTIRIAAIMVQNNPFGEAVKKGVDFAREVLKDRNVKVDWISVPDFDPKKFTDAMENVITAQYDAVTLFGLSQALQPVVDKAVSDGMLVYCFNTEPGNHSKRQAFWGMDDYAAGKTMGKTLEDQMGGKGKYAIITGSFNVLGHELRRKGARSVLDQNPNMQLIGQFENHDKAEEAYNLVQNLLTAHPDLGGIYVTAGGPFGAAKALKDAGLPPGKVKLVCHDWLAETIAYVKEGYVTAVIDQDPFNQGFAPVVSAFNKLAANITPKEINFFPGNIATPENVAEKVPPNY